MILYFKNDYTGVLEKPSWTESVLRVVSCKTVARRLIRDCSSDLLIFHLQFKRAIFWNEPQERLRPVRIT